MNFWFLMILTVMLIPLIMVIFGKIIMHKPPKKINWFFGYRTNSSMKNSDTWEFAQKHSGKLMFLWGLITLLISVIVMLFTLNKNENTISIVSCVITLLQILPFIFIVVSTQNALKKNFDSEQNNK